MSRSDCSSQLPSQEKAASYNMASSDAFDPHTTTSTSSTVPMQDENERPEGQASAAGGKLGKVKALLGLGKNKATTDPTSQTSATVEEDGGNKSLSSSYAKTTTTKPKPSTPIQTDPSLPYLPTSPNRQFTASSPHLASPAGSQIFERDVVVHEGAPAAMPASPAMPSHLATEDQIPAVLDASSEAITNKELDPDSVEIITHASHLPASVTVSEALAEHNMSSSYLGGGVGGGDEQGMMASSFHSGMASSATSGLDREGGSGGGGGAGSGIHPDSSSVYGNLDSSTADVRRLSFISFADVVQAEHSHHQHHSGGGGGGIGSSSSTNIIHATNPRAPSPMRSPNSFTSTTAIAGGIMGQSPSGSAMTTGLLPPASTKMSLLDTTVESGKTGLQSAPLSPTSTSNMSATASPPLLNSVHGDFAVETMSQALQEAKSGDLSGTKSHGLGIGDGKLE